MLPRQTGSQVFLTYACVGENELDELHVARIDALIAGRDRSCALLIESGLQRKPLCQSKMHITFES